MPVMGFCCSRSGSTLNSHSVCLKEGEESFLRPHPAPASLINLNIETLTGDSKQVASLNSSAHIYRTVEAAFHGRYHHFVLFCDGREVNDTWKVERAGQRVVLTLVPVPSYMSCFGRYWTLVGC